MLHMAKAMNIQQSSDKLIQFEKLTDELATAYNDVDPSIVQAKIDEAIKAARAKSNSKENKNRFHL